MHNAAAIAIPPELTEIPRNAQLMFNVGNAIPCLFFLYKGLLDLNGPNGDATRILFLAGGMLASAFEPLVDLLGFCYFPPIGNWSLYESLTGPVPSFNAFTYCWYIGGIGYYYLTLFRDPKTQRRDFFRLWATAFLTNVAMELPALQMKVYCYYGYQPFKFAGFPLWWPCINALIPIVSATLVNLVSRDGLYGYQKLVILVLMPAGDAIANAAFAWPCWLALGKDKGYHQTYPAAVLTFVLAMIGLWCMSRQVPDSRDTEGRKYR